MDKFQEGLIKQCLIESLQNIIIITKSGNGDNLGVKE